MAFKDKTDIQNPAITVYPVDPVSGSTDYRQDGADLPYNANALLIKNAGTIKLTTIEGDTVTIDVPAGLIPLQVKRVWLTGTTATGITALC